MNKALHFKVTGSTAFFKNPDFNSGGKDVSDTFYSFPHITKMSLLGMCGAIVGYDGYSRQKEIVEVAGKNKKKKTEKVVYKTFPEFYEKMKNFKVAIVPKKPMFKSGFMYGTNATGFNNKDGNTFQYREKWLQDVEWDIFILDDGSEAFNKLVEYMLKGECEYIPYLGNNHHAANIFDVEMVSLNEVEEVDFIDSIIADYNGNISYGEDTGDGELAKLRVHFSPTGINEEDNMHIVTKMIITNKEILSGIEPGVVKEYENKNLMFF